MGGGDRAIRRADRDRSGGLTGRSRCGRRGPPLILCRGTELVDGYGTDQICSSGRGQVLIPWPNRLQDGSYEFGAHPYLMPGTATIDRLMSPCQGELSPV